MGEQVGKTVRKGTWIYGENVPSEVWIIQQDFFEGPHLDEESPVGFPPRDKVGMFYYAAYVQQEKIKGVSNLCASAEEAMFLQSRLSKARLFLETLVTLSSTQA